MSRDNSDIYLDRLCDMIDDAYSVKGSEKRDVEKRAGLYSRAYAFANGVPDDARSPSFNLILRELEIIVNLPEPVLAV